jgi:hypothetical protein
MNFGFSTIADLTAAGGQSRKFKHVNQSAIQIRLNRECLPDQPVHDNNFVE